MKKNFLLLILNSAFLILHSFSFAQYRNIDSLLSLIKSDKADTNKVNHLIKLCDEYQKIGLYDTAMYYGDKASQLTQKLNYKTGIASSYNIIGNVFINQGDYPKALEHYFRSLKVADELGNKKIIANNLGNIGTVYKEQADYNKALDYYFKALKISKELEDKNKIAIWLGNIGNVYLTQGDYTKALDYYLKALEIDEGVGDPNGIARHLSNIGLIYYEQKNYPEALNYYLKTLKIAEEHGYKREQANVLSNIGLVYSDQGDYNKALDYYFKALEMTKVFQNKNSNAICLSNIGKLYSLKGKYKEAEQYLERAINMENSIGLPDLLRQTEEYLSQLYDTTRQYNLAFIHYKKATALKDTIFSQENKKQLVRKEMNYEFDKKEAATKAENDKQQAVAEEKSHKQKVVLLLVSCVLLLVFVFAGFVFRSLRITRKQKQIIEIKSKETDEQKKVIAEKNKDMVDSIRYASAIQQAVITSESYIAEHLHEFFVLYLPKDIVAGDFYWAFNQDDEFFIATGDCTGHGVPGAFMSLMGINFLNEIVVEQKIASPAETLNRLREQIIRAFSSGKTERKDGMDICLYKLEQPSLNGQGQRLTYSAANNPLWLCRNDEIIEYKPDKMPVGAHHGALTPFTEHTIALQKGDIIYTSTDGYADQFGENGKKLMKKKLKEELLKIHDQPMVEQKEYLNQFFENWKGNTEQVDDVTIIGVRI